MSGHPAGYHSRGADEFVLPYGGEMAKYSYAMYLFHLFFGIVVLAAFGILGERFPTIDGLLQCTLHPWCFCCRIWDGSGVLSVHRITDPASEREVLLSGGVSPGIKRPQFSRFCS